MSKNVCLITFPIFKSGITPLSNYIDILSELSNDLYVITGNAGYEHFSNDSRINLFNVTHFEKNNFLMKIVSYIVTQLKISWTIFNIRKNIDVSILFFGGHLLILPLLTLKILKKESNLTFADYAIKENKSHTSKLLYLISRINISLADHIILYSKGLINKWNFETCINKILIAPRHFVDFDNFKIDDEYSSRDNFIGYVGRFSEEKGIMNFLHSIPKVLYKEKDVKFIIIGDGPLRKEVLRYIEDNSLMKNVQFIDWIKHDDLPQYLNKLKLLVIPSYTEGLPNIMLESMACGTPVLTTQVGSIPDVIEQEVNGFLIEDNLPINLAEKILYVLRFNKIDYIISNATKDVSYFSFETALNTYKLIIK